MQTLHKKAKTTIAAIAIAIIIASITLVAIPSIGQETGPHGYIDEREGGSIPLPAGVTPDLTIESIPFMSFRPNPVGVGQPVLVNLWMQPPIHVSHYFTDYKVTFTDPDGQTDEIVMDSFRADSTAWFEYAPNKVGTWTVKFDFPGGYFPAGNYTVFAGAFFAQTADVVVNFPQSAYYTPSTDGPYTLTVQQDMVASWPPSPLPTDYWTRPISIENREWWKIGGHFPFTQTGGGPDWPADTNVYASNYRYTPWVEAPETSHIVWKRVGAFGGLYGGYWYQDSYTSGGGTPTIIYQGRCYQTVNKASTIGTGTQSYWQCYDLRTGQQYWERPVYSGETIPSAITFEEGRPEVPGAAPEFGKAVFLISIVGGSTNRLFKYDPYLGTVSQNISIPSFLSSTYYADPYVLSIQDLGASAGANRYRLVNWTIRGSATVTFAERMMSNITWPWNTLGVADFEAGLAVNTFGINHPATGAANLGVAIGQRLESASLLTGAVLMNVTTTGVTEEYGAGGFFSGSTRVVDHGRFAVRLNDGLWHCWDARTGTELWQSTTTSHPWGTFGCYGVQSYGGMIISNQYDGVQAVNWTNGNTEWFFQAKAPYPYETPYQDNYPWFTGTSTIADGKLYTYNTEHTASQPVMRGWRMFCLDINTGEMIWNITGSMAPGGVADGYLTASNTYDGYTYVFGKGISATTVTAPTTAVPKGTTVLIQGTVLDQSPGQSGTPCVAEESMTGYMEFLHMQKACPDSVTGVEVMLSAVKSDGSFIDIGAVTTNGFYGTFSKSWTPPDQGDYTIVASFVGTEAYGSSSAATALSIGPTPATTEPPNVETPPDNTMLLYGILVLVVIAILIGIVALLRKR